MTLTVKRREVGDVGEERLPNCGIIVSGGGLSLQHRMRWMHTCKSTSKHLAGTSQLLLFLTLRLKLAEGHLGLLHEIEDAVDAFRSLYTLAHLHRRCENDEQKTLTGLRIVTLADA